MYVSFGRTTSSAPSLQRLFALPGVLGDTDYAACRSEVPQYRNGKETDAARTDDEHRIVRAGTRLERRVNGASERLHGDSGLVGEIVRHPMELRGMGDERAPRPAAARVAAEAGLDAGCYVALRYVQAEGVASRGAVRTKGLYATNLAAEGWLHNDAISLLKTGVIFGNDTDYFVAEGEGWRGDRGEVRRVLGRQRSQVRAADAG